MANRYAVASGNWSNTATWDGGTLPTSADDVYSNNFNVNIDQNITVLSLRNTSATLIAQGGTFTFNTAGITANISNNIFMATSTVISFILVTATTGTVTLSIPNGNIVGVATSNATLLNHSGNCNLIITCLSLSGFTASQQFTITTYTIYKSSTSILTINGNILGKYSSGSVDSNFYFLNGTVNINGNITGGAGTASGSIAVATYNSTQLTIVGTVTAGSGSGGNAIFSTSTGNINITGNILGSSAATAINISTGTLTITGNVTGNNLNAISVTSSAASVIVNGIITGGSINGTVGINLSGGSLNHVGTAQASAFGSAIKCDNPTTTTITCTGPFLRSTNIVAIASQTLLINSAYNPYFQFRKSDGTNVTYVDQAASNFPAVGNVRLGTSYASGLYTGTLNVPTAAQVLAGIAVDNTTGTLLMTPAQFWNYLISSGFTAGSLGERLQNASTVATTGGQIASYNI